MPLTNSHCFRITLPYPLDTAELIIRTALKKQHFDILTEIDIQGMLREKLALDHVPHKILGACNPWFVRNAVLENADAALALPCNVVLREENSDTEVSAMLPSTLLHPFATLQLQLIACDAEAALARAFDDISLITPASVSPSIP